MIRRSTRNLILALIALCLAAAVVIWLTNPPPAPSPAEAQTPVTENQNSTQVEQPAVGNAQSLPVHALPDRRFTPGAIDPDVRQDNIDTTICVPGFTRSIRPPARYTSRLKRDQLGDPERGYDDRNMRDYEEDHDVPLEVGGNPRDPGNLWPEPLRGSWNAHSKDRLENRMHELVCAHAVTLAEAQAAFLGDWTQAYAKYVGGQ